MASTEEIEPDLSHIHWSFPEAIAANPARSLANGDLAMDYFAFSPFWDPKSNNNVLRVQRRIEQPNYGHAEEKMELEAFNSGFEYIIAHAQPPQMFIIHRREVGSGGRRDIVDAIYWILEGKIYPTPTLYDIMASRTKNAAFLLSETFSTLSALHPPSNPRTSNIWRSLPPSEKRVPPNTTAAAAAATTAEDIEMASASPAIQGDRLDKQEDEEEQEQEQEQEPDWNLFHALQSTQGALGDLRRLAREEPTKRDPKAEMRDAERRTRVMGAGVGGTGVGTPGVVINGGTPGPGGWGASQAGTV